MQLLLGPTLAGMVRGGNQNDRPDITDTREEFRSSSVLCYAVLPHRPATKSCALEHVQLHLKHAPLYLKTAPLAEAVRGPCAIGARV